LDQRDRRRRVEFVYVTDGESAGTWTIRGIGVAGLVLAFLRRFVSGSCCSVSCRRGGRDG
jgi:hypothetical protein